MTGRGKGDLPGELSLMTLESAALQVSAVKQAENGEGLIVRLFNPTDENQAGKLRFGCPVESACRCGMDESEIEPADAADDTLKLSVAPKKIATFRIVTSG